jgi:hypothetical protein
MGQPVGGAGREAADSNLKKSAAVRRRKLGGGQMRQALKKM